MSVSDDDRDEARDQLERAVENLRVWQRGGQRAPHKPLLVLLLLGRSLQGRQRLVPFTDIEEDLRGLLRDFGPPRRSHHPELPFWHLQSDGIWELPEADRTRLRPGGSPPVSSVRTLTGGIPEPLWHRLRDDPDLTRDLARRLLESHFPGSLHDDILERTAIGTLEALMRPVQRRDPQFRLRVLRAYEYRCAVCGYDGRLDTVPVGIEAAHVRWWAAGGPDDVDNGLALCSLHHKAFDLGVIGLSPELLVEVSQGFHGHERAHEYVSRFAGAPALRPQSGTPLVHEAHRRWHGTEVFRGPARVGAGPLAAEPRPRYEN